ncbi:MAG: DNA repair protein RadC [Candidatus Thiodiazotropha lotti]|nr:DNA repair protein RadC [Candidatus Thiodiazotropha lotti]
MGVISVAIFQEITMTKMRKTVRLNAVPHDLNPAEQNQVINLALNILTERHLPGQALTSPKESVEYLRLRFSEYKNEVFCALFLDNRHRILGFEELFFGTINGASVHPRVVVQRCMEINAAAVIFAHNHPSGVSEPSHADKAITNRLKDALEILDVRMLDHIVVGIEGVTSFAETGLL